MTDETTTESAEPTVSEAPAQGAVNGQADGPWYGDLSDDGLKEWASNKGFEDPASALSSYQNLEKLMGADKAGRTIALPKDDDPESMALFRTKIGVPDSAAEYELSAPEGEDTGFSETASEWFHEAGVPKQAAQAISEKWNEFIGTALKEQQDQLQVKSESELAALKSEWGQAFEERAEFGRRGLRQFGEKAGLDDQDLTSLEGAIGTAKMVKLFHAMGETTKEAGFVAGERAAGYGKLDPTQINSKLKDLMKQRIADPTMTEKEYLAKEAELSSMLP